MEGFRNWLFSTNAVVVQDYLFGLKHWLTLAGILVLAIVLPILLRKSERAGKITRFSLVTAIAVFEITRRVIGVMMLPSYSFKTVFEVVAPLELFSLFSIMLIVAYFFRLKQILNFTVIFGFVATLLYLILPTTGVAVNFFNTNSFNFPEIYSLVVPALGFIYIVLAISSGGVKFEIKKVWIPLVCFAGAIVYAVALNLWILPGNGVNYMYVGEPGLGINEWAYRAIVVGVMILLILAFYSIPAWVKAARYFKNRTKPVVYNGVAFKKTGQNNYDEKTVTFKKSGGEGVYEKTKEEKWFDADRKKVNDKTAQRKK